MLPLYSPSLHGKPPLSLQPFSPTSYKLKTCISELLEPGHGIFRKKNTNPYHHSSSFSSSSCIVCAVENESQRFEVDPDKAREALKNLDQQLQSRSQTKFRPPKEKAPDVTFTRDRTKDEQVEEFSGSFFTITAAAVFAFTVFYNVLFYTVIKPAIDGPGAAPYTVVQREILKDQF
ncbi:hypothetical protein ACFX11_030546 [Malus domestica]